MTKTKIAGSISGSEAYTLGELKQRLGLSKWALWRACRRGLKVHKMHKHKFVLGKDFIAYLEKKP